LGSVNLSRFVKSDQVDWKGLAKTVKVGVRMLDNAIDVCKYPLKKVDKVVKSNRKIGLGVMGWADMLVRLRLAYNSPQALKLAEKRYGLESISRIGKRKGFIPQF